MLTNLETEITLVSLELELVNISQQILIKQDEIASLELQYKHGQAAIQELCDEKQENN